MKSGLPYFARREMPGLVSGDGGVALVGTASVVSAADAVTPETFGPGVAVAGAVEVVSSDEGIELLKAVSLLC
jgi:hypothetical protein